MDVVVAMMPTRRVEMNVPAASTGVLMTADRLTPMRMMSTAAQQQVQAEGEERDKGDGKTHNWIVGIEQREVNVKLSSLL
jgi:hypothetical protein